MLASGAFERALEVYQKSLEIDPVDPPALKGLLAVHSARGTADDAVEIIERASADDPGSPSSPRVRIQEPSPKLLLANSSRDTFSL